MSQRDVLSGQLRVTQLSESVRTAACHTAVRKKSHLVRTAAGYTAVRVVFSWQLCVMELSERRVVLLGQSSSVCGGCIPTALWFFFHVNGQPQIFRLRKSGIQCTNTAYLSTCQLESWRVCRCVYVGGVLCMMMIVRNLFLFSFIFFHVVHVQLYCVKNREKKCLYFCRHVSIYKPCMTLNNVVGG